MALVLKKFYDIYDFYFVQYKDDRVSDLFLIKSSWPVSIIVAAYLIFVTGKGQEWMKDRRPFELKRVIIFYNLFQIVLNAYIAIGATSVLIYHRAPLFCIQPPYNDFTPFGMAVLHFSHVYYLTKIIDLLDTVFFVLRKKNNQISFLHIYHHTMMAFGNHFYIRFLSGGGQATVLGVVNSYVHVIMYGYYFMTSFKAELKQSIWWKRHITQVQLLQFSILFCHFLVPLFYDCGFPKSLSLALALQNIFMLVLFGDFYYKAYIKKKPSLKSN